MEKLLESSGYETESRADGAGSEIEGVLSKSISWEKLSAFLGALSSSKRVRPYQSLWNSWMSERSLSFRWIVTALILFFVAFFGIQYAKAEELRYVQYRPSSRPERKRDCSKSLSSLLTQEQMKALADLQNSFYTETSPLRRDLMVYTIEFRRLLSEPEIDRAVILGRQKKILELQSKLKNISFSYQMRARSIFTSEQLDRLPWDCMLGMDTGFGIKVRIGRSPRKGHR